MAKITEIYKQYKITSALQVHQLRVAAVAKTICQSYQGKLDEDTVIKACLLHDMGNIIKFDLGHNPAWLEPEGLDYWQKVQADFKQKYGPDEHHASIEIAKELGVGQKVIDCIDAIGFSKIVANHSESSVEKKICNYADMRVAPLGVVSIHARMKDGHERYQHREGYILEEKKEKAVARKLTELESQLFSQTDIKPGDITDESIEPIIEQLKSYEI